MEPFTRRNLLGVSAGASAAIALGLPLLPLAKAIAGQESSRPGKPRIDEYDEANTKVGHIVPASLSDDDILFLKQIGLRYVLVSFNPDETPLEKMRVTQERFARQH